MLPLDQNLLQKLEKYNNEPYMFFIKVDQIFLKGQYMAQPALPLIQIFQNMLETEIKHEL